MNLIGFSTGALALADFRSALAMMRGKPIQAVELSALRQEELVPLAQSIDTLDLSQFRYISIHAPSRFKPEDEPEIVSLLSTFTRRGWPVILHPDSIHDFSLWRDLGSDLLIENMDKRKPIGRFPEELHAIFDKLPDACFCFDIGHARQVDPTMSTAYFLLKAFTPRLRQLHVSEVNSRSTHDPLSFSSILAFNQVAEMISPDLSVILETPVPANRLLGEIRQVMRALPNLRRPQKRQPAPSALTPATRPPQAAPA